MSLLIEFVLPFVAITLIMLAVLMWLRDYMSQNRMRVDERIGRGETDVSLQQLPVDVDEAPPRGVIARIDRSFGDLVSEAGITSPPEAAFLMAVVVGLSVGGVLFIWRDDLLAGTAGMVFGLIATIVYYTYLRSRRLRRIRDMLPDVIELLARAVRAGESLDQAVGLVGDTAAQPLGVEFRRCARQLDMGLSLDVAMRALTRRAPLTEMRIMAATLMVQRRTGGNLPVTLERLAKVVRDRLSYQRQFRAATAAGRISTMLIAATGPMVALYMSIWQRDYIERFVTLPKGHAMLAIAIVLQIIGLTWIYRLLKTDY